MAYLRSSLSVHVKIEDGIHKLGANSCVHMSSGVNAAASSHKISQKI